MKQESIIILLSLFIALFIYIFYRTDLTVVNRILICVVGSESFCFLKKWICQHVELNPLIVYSLPEGLWVFAVTYLSTPFFINIYKMKIPLFYLPITYTIGLELCQLFEWLYGVYDLYDIVVSIFFWNMGTIFKTKKDKNERDILKCRDIDLVICLSSYVIVYLSHVWR